MKNPVLYYLGMTVGIASLIIPAMELIVDDKSRLPDLGVLGWYGVAAFGGGVSGWLIKFESPRIGILGGVLAAVGYLTASLIYAGIMGWLFSRESLFILEVAVAGILGAAPGLLMLFADQIHKLVDEQPPSEQRPGESNE